MSIVREEAKKILNNLPDEASWDDVMYEMYVSLLARVSNELEIDKFSPRARQ